MHSIQTIIGETSIERYDDRIVYSYGAFVSRMAEIMHHVSNTYYEPSSDVYAIELLKVFPPTVSHVINPVITEVHAEITEQ